MAQQLPPPGRYAAAVTTPLPTARPQPARWIAAVVAALAVFVFTRVRGELPLYVALHRWWAELGIPAAVRNLDGPLLLLAAAWLACVVARAPGGAWRGLGLRAPLAPALVFAGLAGAPMVLQAALASEGPQWSSAVLRGVLVAPFVEEVFFRGVLVGIPVRLGGRTFWPVAILAGALFGAMHVPWSAEFAAGHLGVLAATTAGGIWYAWLYRTFAWNLWTTIGLHAVMNGAWLVFGAADDAAGGLWPNVGRGLTIAVGTLLALRHRRRATTASPATT